jgi:hypothetical protein
MITTRKVQREVTVKGFACDGPDCERFEETGTHEHIPWDWYLLDWRLAIGRTFCSAACVKAWASVADVEQEAPDALPDLQPEPATA